MRRCVSLIALLFLLGAVVHRSALAAVRHHRTPARRIAPSRPASSRPIHTPRLGHLTRAAAYLPARTSRHHRRLRTAARLRHARHHGTAAVQAAARAAQLDAAENQSTATQPRDSASLNLPQAPLHVINLPPLRGTRESLIRQNQRADQEGLARVRDDADIVALLHNKLLVPLPTAYGLHADPRLPENRRYCRPWTSSFLADLSRAHYQRFRGDLQINSAVRTIAYQRHLLHVNGNAAPAEGDIASPHLTGATIDIGKKGMSPAQVAWMRAYLLPLETAGRIDVEEEFHQSCFHISVYQSYRDPTTPARSAAALLATHLR